MKRPSLILLTLLLTATLAVFAACGVKEPECEHSYDHACDLTCNECGETREAAHDYAAADCDTPKTCKTCGETDGEALGHTPEADDGDCTTATLCSICRGIVVEANDAHTPADVDDDCTTPVTCAHCLTVVVEAQEHDFNEGWNATVEEHFHGCLHQGCSANQGSGKHVPAEDDGDCTTNVLCVDCEWVVVNGLESHTPSEDDGNCTTAIKCSVCDTVTTEAKTEHTPAEDDKDCTTPVTCAHCPTVVVEALEHDFNEGWNATHEEHYHVCRNGDCLAEQGRGNHVPEKDDGNCTTSVLCADCGWTVVEALESHTPAEDDEDCSTPVTCVHCPTVLVEALEHDFYEDWNSTADGHFHACLNQGCSVYRDHSNHVPEEDDGDCTTDLLCSECGWAVVEGLESHTPLADDGNCTTAIKCSTCDTVTTEAKAEHSLEDDGDCLTEQTCTECGLLVIESRAFHEDGNMDGVCDYCTYEYDYHYDGEIDTYYIYTADGLYAWRNDYYGSGNVSLMRNIDMPEELVYDLDGNGENDSNWKPLYFAKSFDGNGYSISGITVNYREGNHVAFLDNLDSSGIVKNLSLVDVSVQGSLFVAGITARNYGTIINCSVSGSVYATGNDAAGIAAVNSGTIIACSNAADVYAKVGGAAGIVGQMISNGTGQVIGCYNTGRITADGEGNGGIVGNGYAGNYVACFATAEVIGTKNVGSLAGYADSDCYLTACYYISESEDLKGIGSNFGQTAFRVDGTTLTLADAIAAMNQALADGGYNWQYVVNEGADADVRPVLIVEIE